MAQLGVFVTDALRKLALHQSLQELEDLAEPLGDPGSCLGSSDRSKPSGGFARHSSSRIAIRRTEASATPVAPYAVEEPDRVREQLDAWVVEHGRSGGPDRDESGPVTRGLNAGVRDVDLSLDVMDELMAWRASRPSSTGDEFVFATDSGRPRDKDNVRERVLRPVVNRTNEQPNAARSPSAAAGESTRAQAHVHQPADRGGSTAPVRDAAGRTRGLTHDARGLRTGPTAAQSQAGSPGVR